MKRALIATILGLAASVGSTYGQANYFFDTYAASLAAPQGVVTWSTTPSLAPAGEAGLPVTAGDAISADLLWASGAATGDLGLAVLTTIAGGTSGWIQAPGSYSFDPTYVANSPITFTIEVWQGASFLTGTAKGTETWIEPGQGGGPTQAAEIFQNLPGTPITINSISVVPEPTTLALAGLGAAGMLLFRKRQ
jgi:hypothetical protein